MSRRQSQHQAQTRRQQSFNPQYQQSHQQKQGTHQPSYPVSDRNCESITCCTNKIKIKIFNSFVTALIDTGCSTSVLSEALLRRLHVSPQTLEPGDTTFLIGANATKIPLVGKVLLPIKLHGLTVPFDFLVAKNLTHEIMIGDDFLRETKALINYADSSISFHDHIVEIPFLQKHQLIASTCQNFKTFSE